MTTELAEAVEALTKPTKTNVRQGTKVTVVKHDPLLVQLQNAITSTITGKAGGGGQSTGNVLNSTALYQASLISAVIGDWCHMADVRIVRGDMVASLTQWHLAIAGDESPFHIRKMEEWASTIRGLLNPLVPVPLKDPCAVCKASTYVDADGEEQPRPVVVAYDPHDPFGTAQASCLACGVEWETVDAIKELIEEMEADRG